MALKQATRSLKLSTPLGENELLLTAFQGQEQMSRLFQFDLEMISDNNAIAAKDLVGKNVTFSVDRADGSVRHFNGFVSRFSAGDEDDEGRRNYRARVVPWLWFLTRTSDCRIFQKKKIPDIVEQIFGDLGFSDFDKSKIKGSHPQWEYCVQYRETDFAFVSRLLEQEGIYFFFKHEQGKHTLVLADQKTGYEKCAESEVDFPRDFGTAAVVDHLTSWEHAYEFRTGKWAHTDFNFETPSNNLMTNEQTVVQLPGVDKYEVYDYPGEYGTTGDGTPLAKVRMEEEELEHDVVRGGGTCKSFCPGYKFTVGQHRSGNETGKGYVITAVQHWAAEPLGYETGGGSDSGPTYRNTFSCIPDSVVFRPARVTPKPVVRGCQTAIVTGPSGEEIYPDKYGRVKVQFHWDREGKKDENTSCWIRVSQIHAGQGWGTMLVPRIGEEVIVDFLEGDPDRPIIIGRVYHAENMPPYDLPGSKNLYGMKSNSTKGGGGYNEYVFDDTKSNELIREHGQFDKDSTIEHDLREHVLNDRSRDVTNNETILIGVDRTKTVGNNETLNVGANRTRNVGANESVTVAMNRSHTVGVAEAITVGAAQAITIGAGQALTIGAGQAVNIGAMQSVSVGASQSIDVGANLTENVGGNRSSTIGKNETVRAGKTVTIEAGDQISIKTGKASIVMKKDGTISISGKDITVDGSGKITAKAAKDMVLKGKKILQN
jgi:type VI secretion system secreted protein VgrG